jgi:hypothetical protein
MTKSSQVRLGAVLPIHHLGDLQPLLDYAFVEPIDDARYTAFYKVFKGLKILDNSHGQYGTDPASCERLFEYAKLVDATEVIAPDKLGDWSFNYSWARAFAKLWPKNQTLVCLAGPQAGSFSMQADYVLNEGYAGVCLPYRLNRTFGNYGDRLHLLGLRAPEQFHGYLGEGHVDVSLDTSEPISAASRGVHYASDGGLWTVKRPKNYMRLELTKEELRWAAANISFLKQWIAERSQPTPI